MSCLKPLNSARRPTQTCGFVDNASALPTSPTGPNNKQKRTFDVLQTADIFTRYGQAIVNEEAGATALARQPQCASRSRR